MRSLRFKLPSLLFTRVNSICFILLVSLFITFLVPRKVVAAGTDVTSSLNSIFGDPDTFVSNFESQTKDKADEIIGFLISAFGFRLVIKSFMG